MKIKFDLNTLLQLILFLLETGSISIFDCETLLKSKKVKNCFDFLHIGKFILKDNNQIKTTKSLDFFWNALKNQDYNIIFNNFCSIPSIFDFFEKLRKNPIITNFRNNSYLQIAEICGKALFIPKNGIYGTFNDPPIDVFVDNIIEAYTNNTKGEKYILVGKWLEILASKYGIHPIIVKSKLAEAYDAGMIERYTQGSTPDFRFDRHMFSMLKFNNEQVTIDKINLYHGDFILPGKSSVRIMIIKK